MRRSLILLAVLLATQACRENARPDVSTTDAPAPIQTTREPAAPTTPPTETAGIEDVVRAFGSKLQLVSLLAPASAVEQSMRQHYAPFVAPSLLEKWIKDPASAPGRRVSSPWPDRIEIQSVTRQGADRAVVDGEIVEITSDSSDSGTRIPVRLTMEHNAAGWQIVELASREKKSEGDNDGADGAVAVIDAYYAAINRRDYPTAHRYWSSNGAASGQTLAEFTRGFADTASVAVDIGTPGRIDPAAGSRYIEIPVTVTARTRAGETQRFRGHYVLRRSVVDGATAEQRQWRIASAALKTQ